MAHSITTAIEDFSAKILQQEQNERFSTVSYALDLVNVLPVWQDSYVVPEADQPKKIAKASVKWNPFKLDWHMIFSSYKPLQREPTEKWWDLLGNPWHLTQHHVFLVSMDHCANKNGLKPAANFSLHESEATKERASVTSWGLGKQPVCVIPLNDRPSPQEKFRRLKELLSFIGLGNL